MLAEKKLEELGIVLPEVAPPAPEAKMLNWNRIGNTIYTSGHGPKRPDGTLAFVGKLGADLTTPEGYQAARLTTINLLASLKQALGDLDRVKNVAKILVMVNSAPDFTEQPLVGHGASDLLVEVFGPAGRHARSAVGMGQLPNNMAVEIEMIVEVTD